MSTIVLVDGDILAYTACSSNEISTHWGDGLWTLHVNEDDVKRDILWTLDDVKRNLSVDEFVICLTDKDNFRKDVLPSYKSNRKETRKPMCLPAIREWLVKEHGAIIWPKLEADDVLGILATKPKREATDNVIVFSRDKDLKSVPCQYTKNGIEVETITKQEADYNFLKQSLMGDMTDGYTGIKGVGEVKAKKILGDVSDFTLEEGISKVKEAYTKAGYDEHDMLQQINVARILRHGDYKEGEIKLWQ